MPNSLRNTDPSIVHLITLRTHEAALWMLPSPQVEEIIGGVLARYQEIFSIVIYCYSFVTNHYHLLVKAPRGNLDEFEENINREIARRINKLNSRRGKFWARRYDDLIVPTEDDMLEAFLYIITNATKHGLVKNPREWPGINCLRQFEANTERKYSFTHYSKRDENGKPTKSTHILTLSSLPQFAAMSAEERTSFLSTYIHDRVELLKKNRYEVGHGFLGASGVKNQRLGALPREVARTRRPICYTKNPEVRRQFRKLERERRARFFEASRRFRLGNLAYVFPSYCHRPPLHRVPRLRPFEPLPLEKIAA